MEDERTLSLSKLENRLSQWKEQRVYQQNLLDRYLQQNGVSFSALDTMDTETKMAQVERSAVNMATAPAWENNDTVLQNGEIVNTPTLSIGPVTWFLFNDSVNLAERQENRFNAIGDLPNGLMSPVKQLVSTSKGEIVFDPTLGRALTREASSESVIEHIVKGGIWVIPILVFALLATVIAVLKVIQLWKLPPVITVASLAAVDRLINAGDSARETVKGMQRKLLDVAINAPTHRERDDQLFVQLQHDKHQLDKWINAVAVTAAVAPLLGLLGTVSGMIETFRMMTSFGSSDPEVISGGIAKALVTTELGLVVAIPALILNALLSRKAKRYYTELENFALMLSGDDVLESEPKKAHVAASSNSPGTSEQPAGAM